MTVMMRLPALVVTAAIGVLTCTAAPAHAADAPAKVRAESRATNPAPPRAQENARASGLNHNDTLRSTKSIVATPPGGHRGTFRARGYSYVRVPLFEVKANFTNNRASVAWLGATPYNARGIKMTETWKTRGIAVSLSSSPSLGLSGGGSSASDATSASNAWRVESHVDSVLFEGLAIYQVRHTVSGKFRFGSSWSTTVTTSDSSLV
jgi:hypothetical protein